MRVIFAGTPSFALPSLEALHDSAHQVVAVYTQPDRPSGRGRQLAPSVVKQYAAAHQIPIHQPGTLREEAATLAGLAPEVVVVAAYGLLLPRAVLEVPKYGCVNVHASLLPRWRGAAPIARAIEAGDQETGITIMQMEVGLDTGPMWLQRTTPILASDNTATLESRLARLGAEALMAALTAITEGRLTARAQDDASACYAPKLQKREAPVSWSLPATVLHRKIRALNPWPVATTTWRGETLRLWEVGPLREVSGASRPPGTVIGADGNSLHIQTGEGVLDVTRLQAAGGRVLSSREFLNGTRLQMGERLGH